MRVAIVCAVAALACVALVSQGVAGRPFDMRRHRGALNHRLTQEQMNEYNEAIQPQWFNQTLDHENIVGTATFPQQYLVNDTFWNPNAPLIFLMIGGEGPISPAYVNGEFQIQQE